jgi:alginate O-acetyltransferase complex protein AlgJ
VIVPDKATVHPEFLPSRWRPASGPSRVDALAVAATAVDIDVVDLRGALRQAARERITYDAMGTHWNEYGAFVGYRALLQAAGVSDERLLPASALRAEPADGGDSGLAVALGLGPRPEAGTIRMAWKQAPTARDALRPVAFAGTGDPRHAITASLRPGTEGPRVALIRDSFGRQLRGFFAETFPAVLFVWSRTLALSATEAAAVERFAPDLVIELFVERSLYEDAGQFQPLP